MCIRIWLYILLIDLTYVNIYVHISTHVYRHPQNYHFTYDWAISYYHCTCTMPGKKTPPGSHTSSFDVSVSRVFLVYANPFSYLGIL